MATILRGKSIPLNDVLPVTYFFLLRISPIEEYNEEGKKTGKILGYYYHCVEPNEYTKIKIKIKNQEIPLMTNADLQATRQKGDKVIVEFMEPTVLLYYNSKTQSFEDSFSAQNVMLTEIN